MLPFIVREVMQLTDRDKVAHLLRRFGFGASEAELDYYSKNGLSGAINLLLEYEKVEDVFTFNPMEWANQQRVVNLRVMQGLYAARMICTLRPLEEKMTLFWHNHFATSSSKVENSYVMANHIEMLRTNAMGKFGTLLEAASKDVAMIYWLDAQENVVGQANENFAREVMELFTLGIGHYSEQDVQEAARAFTGWTYGGGIRARGDAPNRNDRYVFVPNRHDGGPKRVLGAEGRLTGEDVLKTLCQQEQTSKFITTKLWSWFAYENPEEAVVNRISKAFRESDLDIKVLVRAVMEAPEFYSEKAVRRVIKNPIDFVVSTVRQLGLGQQIIERIKDGIANPIVNEQNGLNIKLTRALGPAFAVHSSATSMGMELMTPPDVSGWRTGSYWITSATMVERMKWADKLFATAFAPGGGGGGGGIQNRNPQVGFQAFDVIGDAPSAAAAVDTLLSLFDVKISDAKKKGLLEAATPHFGTRLNQRSANDLAKAVCKLVFSSPEFQVC
ncbi:MAG TPA: DUF1800 domain-containing protein [Fimbriimonas sp.]|nr:DUF1800 domain-containing protein [Fimbriimonas sp.]